MTLLQIIALLAYLFVGVMFALFAEKEVREEKARQLLSLTLVWAALFWLPIIICALLSIILCKIIRTIKK